MRSPNTWRCHGSSRATPPRSPADGFQVRCVLDPLSLGNDLRKPQLNRPSTQRTCSPSRGDPDRHRGEGSAGAPAESRGSPGEGRAQVPERHRWPGRRRRRPGRGLPPVLPPPDPRSIRFNIGPRAAGPPTIGRGQDGMGRSNRAAAPSRETFWRLPLRITP